MNGVRTPTGPRVVRIPLLGRINGDEQPALCRTCNGRRIHACSYSLCPLKLRA
jgi:hypothetical protein